MPLKTELYLNKIKYNSLSKIFGNCIKHKINLVAFLNSKTKQFSSYFQWLKRVDNEVDARNKNQTIKIKGQEFIVLQTSQVRHLDLDVEFDL